jgi:hypothetical protein
MPLKIAICSPNQDLTAIKSFIATVTAIKPIILSSFNELIGMLENADEDYFCFMSEHSLTDPVCSDFFPFYKKENLKVFLYFDWEKVQTDVQTELKKRKTIFGQCLSGIVDFSRPMEIFAPAIRDGINSSGLNGNFGDMVDNYQNVIDGMIQKELKTLKDLKLAHHSYVKLRSEKNKFFILTSRYLAGLAPGGDFFDTIQSDQGLLVILSATSSYVVSGMVLAKFEELKRKKKSDFEEIMREFRLLAIDIKNTMNDDKLLPKFLFMKIDHEKMKLDFCCFGDFLIVSTNGLADTGNPKQLGINTVDEVFKSHQLAPGERIILTSPGIFYVSNGKIQGQPIISYLREELKRDAGNCINELFFNLKENNDGDYASYDSSAIVIEVKKNVIREV